MYFMLVICIPITAGIKLLGQLIAHGDILSMALDRPRYSFAGVI